MYRRLLTCLLSFISFLVIANAYAVVVSDINTADIPVSDRSNSVLQQGFHQALNQVLIKISGNTGVPTLPAVQNAQPKLSDLIESYAYSAEAEATPSAPLLLHVIFNQNAIYKLLKNAGQSIWGSDRPLTLLWVSVPQDSSEAVLSSDSATPLIASIKQLAKQRGVPILFPTMDLEDEADVALTSSQLPANDQLTASAQRYAVQSVLAGSIVVNNSQLVGEWKLVLNGTPYEWQSSGADLTQVVTNAMDRAADMMANQLSAVDSQGLQSTVIMQVSGVNDLDDYVHVVDNLRRLTPVSTVVVSDMSNNLLLLKVSVSGGVNGLMEALKNSQNLVLQAAPADVGLHQATLFYQWGHPNQPDPGSHP